MSFQHATLGLLGLYACVVFGLNALLRRRTPTGQHYLHASREVSVLVTSLSFLAANCSALEVLSMIAIAAKYGMLAVHFYWIGAVPGLALLVWVFLPRYQQLEIRSVPEYLGKRFGASARRVSALALLLLVIQIGGVILGLLARLLGMALGCTLTAAVCGSAVLAMVFLVLGGLSAVLYAEAIQVLLLVLVLVPLTWHILHTGGGLHGVLHALPAGARHPFLGLRGFSPSGSCDLVGIVGGLGLTLGCTYWCSDYLLIQRLYATRTGRQSQLTPVFTIGCKLFLPLVLVLPGLWLQSRLTRGPASYDLLLPRLLVNHYSQLLATSTVVVLTISLFFGLCGNVAAGVALGIEDFFLHGLDPGKLLCSSRRLTAVLIALCVPSAFFSLHSNAVMENVQFALANFNAPVAVVFMAGVLSTRWTAAAGTPAILAGTCCGLAAWLLAPVWHAGSGLQVSFYVAMAGSLGAFATLCLITALSQRQARPMCLAPAAPSASIAGKLAAIVGLACMAVLYWVFR